MTLSRSRTVARRLDDAPVISGNFGVNQHASKVHQRRECTFFVSAHQPAAVCDISCEYGSKAASILASAIEITLVVVRPDDRLGRLDHQTSNACFGPIYLNRR